MAKAKRKPTKGKGKAVKSVIKAPLTLTAQGTSKSPTPSGRRVMTKRPQRMSTSQRKMSKKPGKSSLQPYIQVAIKTDPIRGEKQAVTVLSENQVPPNKKINNRAKPARYNTKTGLPGPKADFAAPVVAREPIAATDYRQYLMNTPTNRIIDMNGVTNNDNRMPRQQLAPPKGGKYSGRTGPI